MVKFFENEEAQKSKRHDDFDSNKFYATSWISRYEKFNFTKYPEMETVKVKIGKNHAGEQPFVMISTRVKGIIFANPVELNQNEKDFKEELKLTYNSYVKMALIRIETYQGSFKNEK